MGICFVVLAKRYCKNKFIFFCIGFLSSFSVRILYLIIYGFFTDFKVNEGLDYHRNLSVLCSLIISYILFVVIRKKIKENTTEYVDIDEIGIEKD
ncbi:hypothetical protein [uncultured Polaribacter sp.]|uniref:hypothetical protein n=1 Tax=uncultured Polaribacter sp. TaxID=174711 RepID=UPI002633131D|nr:hypothetical protein [uncultured Polaribacter sp.]